MRKLISKQTELLRQNIAVVAGDWNYQTKYEFTGLNDIKPEMIAQATANAREAADVSPPTATANSANTDSVEGQFSIEDRDQYTPNIKTVRVVTYITYYLED